MTNHEDGNPNSQEPLPTVDLTLRTDDDTSLSCSEAPSIAPFRNVIVEGGLKRRIRNITVPKERVSRAYMHIDIPKSQDEQHQIARWISRPGQEEDSIASISQKVAPPLTLNGGIVGSYQGLRLSQMNKQTTPHVERLYQEETATSVCASVQFTPSWRDIPDNSSRLKRLAAAWLHWRIGPQGKPTMFDTATVRKWHQVHSHLIVSQGILHPFAPLGSRAGA